MKTITKWLLSYTESNTLSIEVKEVNPYIPLNRYLKNVGWYNIERVSINGIHYLITSEQHERKGNMTNILVTKINDNVPVSLDETDKGQMSFIAENYLRHIWAA